MQTINRFPLFALILLTLSGCTQYAWVKEAGDPATYPSDNYACKQSALQNAPPVFQVYETYPNFYGPDIIRSHCYPDGPRQYCKTWIYTQSYMPPPPAYDLNLGARNDLYNACMNAKGWTLQPIEPSKE